MGKEVQDAWRMDILDIQAVRWFADLGADKWQQQREGVAIALLRVAGKTALSDDVISQEAPEPGAERRGSPMVSSIDVAVEADRRFV
jgi:hypothetical protein